MVKEIPGYADIDTTIFKARSFSVQQQCQKANFVGSLQKTFWKKGNGLGSIPGKSSITKELKVLHKDSKKQFLNRYTLKRSVKQANPASCIWEVQVRM